MKALPTVPGVVRVAIVLAENVQPERDGMSNPSCALLKLLILGGL